MGARVIQVVETDLGRRGSGKDEGDPIRVIRQYWSVDGELLAEVDPRPNSGVLRKMHGLRRLIADSNPLNAAALHTVDEVLSELEGRP
jgi:hypothetical protein